MNNIRDILGMICSEAIEHGGIPEVPDNKHGAKNRYHSEKREARKSGSKNGSDKSDDSEKIDFRLKVVEDEDGTLEWIE